jgi:hypothetical protein
MKLGKQDPVKGAYKLHLVDYIKTVKLPTPPTPFGWDYLITDWGMLANDQIGDCVIAGGLHETLMWNAAARNAVNLSDASAIANYSAVTGYDPTKVADDGSNPTDNGTNVEQAARYRVTHGLVDADGKTHTIAGYLALNPGDLAQMASAAWIFGAVGLGLQLPDYAMTQLQNGQTWDVQDGGTIEGGHYVPIVGKTADGLWKVVTWGQIQTVTDAFIAKYCDEALVYLSAEMMANGVTLDGLNWQQLQDDWKQVRA